MPVINRLAEFEAELTQWRRQLHSYPETGFEEYRTAALVAEKLLSFGIETHQGIGGTGVVGMLRGNSPGASSVGLRADMDALNLVEKNGFDHASRNPGKMHACGHDGHTAMLLGAARYLAETRNFAGTVFFVFQPAEEGLGGARRMIEDGLFERFPMDRIYGMHNWPGLPAGSIAVHEGPVMAATDRFDLKLFGRGAHAAQPHRGIDTIVAAAHLITALQSIASRNVDPLDSVVLTVGQIHGGEAYNIIPDEVVLRGTVRAFRREVRESIEPAMRRIAEGVCAAFGAAMELDYREGFPATVNPAEHAAVSRSAAELVVGRDALYTGLAPNMAAEDFSVMLEERPGSYVWIGNGPDTGGRQLHSPTYDFNDEILTVGASYWSKLVETILPSAP